MTEPSGRAGHPRRPRGALDELPDRVERPQAKTAIERQREHRRRAGKGVRVYPVPIDAVPVIDALVRDGRLAEPKDDDKRPVRDKDREVADALAALVHDWARASR